MDNDEMHFEEEVGFLNLFFDVGFKARQLETWARYVDTREWLFERHLPLVGMRLENIFPKANIILHSV